MNTEKQYINDFQESFEHILVVRNITNSISN
jgi:hypothetical protein